MTQRSIQHNSIQSQHNSIKLQFAEHSIDRSRT